jgi:hypothetical protein
MSERLWDETPERVLGPRYDPPMADLLDIIRDDQACTDLARYFVENTSKPYSGRRFEALAGGGDRPETRNLVAADDLVAVQMLSVHVPAEAAIDLLDGALGRDIAKYLQEIPGDVELGTPAAADLVADKSAANAVWALLKKQKGISFVIAGKLLARKRPKLIPVYDRVIRCLFGEPAQVWEVLHGRLAADGEELRQELIALRDRTGVPASISALRVLDVVLWMRHRSSHQRTACAYAGTVAL